MALQFPSKWLERTHLTGCESEKLVSRVERSGGRAIFSVPGVRVKRNVSGVAKLIRAAGCPIEGGVENISPAISVPLEPGVRLATDKGTLADNQLNMLRAVRLHPLVKGDRFTFTIGDNT